MMENTNPHTITLEWEKFSNFFSLWEKHKKSTQLLYVIGENHHCYIGCIGIDGGKGGLGQRYQKQYVYRSIAIFGMDESAGQVSFAGLFSTPETISKEMIAAAEASVQDCFIRNVGRENALFSPESLKSQYTIHHTGAIPAFFS